MSDKQRYDEKWLIKDSNDMIDLDLDTTLRAYYELRTATISMTTRLIRLNRQSTFE